MSVIVSKRWAAAVGALWCVAGPGLAADLYNSSNWPALVSDRRAERVGDSLTIVIKENSTGTNTTLSDTKKSSGLSGLFSSGNSSTNNPAQLALSSNFDSSGQTGRTGKIVAQISVVVDEVLPNGDLHVSGAQALNINGEKTNIKLKGRVRSADISSTNTVPSNLLADAMIDYDGSGFVTRSTRPGLLTKVFNWLGLF